MIVADTNLVAYLVMVGDRTGEAEAVLRRDARWTAPPLWRSELHTVIVQHLRAGRLDASATAAIWTRAEVLLGEGTREPQSGRILNTAIDRGLSSYNAEFVALAEELGVPLVTDDRRLLSACRDVAISVDEFAGDANGPGARADAADR